MARPNNFHRTLSSMLTRDEAAEMLVPLADDYFIPAIQAGIESMALLKPEQRRPLAKRTLANMLNDYIVDEAVRRFAGVPDIRIDRDLGFATIVVQDAAAVRIKKTDGRGRYSNYPTKQQVDLRYQYLPGFVGATQVIFGYHLDDLWRSIKSVSFVCWRGDTRHWEIPVADDLHAYLPVIAEEEKARRSVVIPKASKSRRAKGG